MPKTPDNERKERSRKAMREAGLVPAEAWTPKPRVPLLRAVIAWLKTCSDAGAERLEKFLRDDENNS